MEINASQRHFLQSLLVARNNLAFQLAKPDDPPVALPVSETAYLEAIDGGGPLALQAIGTVCTQIQEIALRMFEDDAPQYILKEALKTTFNE